MQAFLKFSFPDEQFLAEQSERVVHWTFQHFADGQKARFLVVDDTAVGRDTDFAVGKGIEGIQCLVRTYARRQVR